MSNKLELPTLEKQFGALESTSPLSLEEPHFLVELRKRATSVLQTLPIPNQKNEAWKYTPVKGLLDKKFSAETISVAALSSAEEEKLRDATIAHLDCYTLVLVNGTYSQPLSDQVNAEELKILDMKSAFSEDCFNQYFGKEHFENEYFLALNLSKAHSGIYIEVPQGVHVSKPLHIVNMLSGSNEHFLNTRALLVMKAHSSLELIETTLTGELSNSLVQNRVVEVILEDQSRLVQTTIQLGNAHSALINNQDVHLERDSHYTSHTFTLKGAFTRNVLNLFMKASNVEAYMNGFYQAEDGELVDNHTLADHQKSHCQSHELYKGILKGSSTGVFNGKVFVHPDAQKTDAYQQNSTILLDAGASMNSKPELEIYADDVKCSHGSTIGQLNADSLFYLKARGISEETGKILLIKAFAHELTQRLARKPLREHVNELIGD